MPAYEHDLDNILGIINQKDYHNYVVGTEKTVSDFIKPVVFVVETMKISELLKKMQHMKTHLAVIVDEYGGTEGIVTIEDIVEELVSEIYNEHDAVMSQEIIPLQNGSYRVMGSANISKVLDYSIAIFFDPAPVIFAATSNPSRLILSAEIGRASCRERV